MTRSTIPHSGDFMRLFARTPMTGAALRIANALAGHISYDGTFRGAPHGFAAFTMSELRTISALSERAVRAALDELANLFGLTIHRRHHARHLFQFSRVSDDVAGASSTHEPDVEQNGQRGRPTGSTVPVPLYTKKTRNNDTVSEVIILGTASSVYQTPFASIIEDAKKGTAAETMDTQFLWNGFRILNMRNNHATTPLSWLVAFVRKAKPRYGRAQLGTVQTPSTPSPERENPVTRMAQAAPFANRAFHESDLRRAIGDEAYKARIDGIVARFGGTRFAAGLAVHGQAIQEGTITP